MWVPSKAIKKLKKSIRELSGREANVSVSFEWDANKDGINQQKHGISFDSACYVFEDLFAIIEYDEKHSVCEDRFCIIGKVFSFFVFVIFTVRQDHIRIISARLATRGEVKRYFDRNKDCCWR